MNSSTGWRIRWRRIRNLEAIVSGYTLMPFGLDDTSGLLALSETIGWPHTLADWHTTLAAGMAFGHRSAQGEIVSSAVIFLYGYDLASVGMVLVKPTQRGQGLAKALMQRGLASLPSPASPVMLIATPEGFP